MATTWTPGPVRIRRITKEGGWFEYDFITDDGAGRGTYATARFYGKNHEADARLWAQAPAMAEVLRQLVVWAEAHPSKATFTGIHDARAILSSVDNLPREDVTTTPLPPFPRGVRAPDLVEEE